MVEPFWGGNALESARDPWTLTHGYYLALIRILDKARSMSMKLEPIRAERTISASRFSFLAWSCKAFALAASDEDEAMVVGIGMQRRVRWMAI